MENLIVKTKKTKEVVDITDIVNGKLAVVKDGICHLFLKHTTAALMTADLDPGGTVEDYLEAFEKLLPKINYRHPHDPGHMPDHILSSLIGASLVLPARSGKLVLGTWQRVVLIEFDGPREREIVISVISSAA